MLYVKVPPQSENKRLAAVLGCYCQFVSDYRISAGLAKALVRSEFRELADNGLFGNSTRANTTSADVDLDFLDFADHGARERGTCAGRQRSTGRVLCTTGVVCRDTGRYLGIIYQRHVFVSVAAGRLNLRVLAVISRLVVVGSDLLLGDVTVDVTLIWSSNYLEETLSYNILVS